MYDFFFIPSSFIFLKVSKRKTKFFFNPKEKISSNLFEYIRKKNSKNSFFFLEQLVMINKYTNLISKKAEYDIYRKHFLDTLTLGIFLKCFEFKKKKNSCLDIGTGSGFPGLLLSIIFPEFFFLLLESIQKKSHFHQKIIGCLSLNNSSALNTRAEGMGKAKQHRKKYDFLTARAVSELNPLIQFSSPFVKKNGKIIFSKQTYKINEEIKQAQTSLRKSMKKIKGVFFVSSLNNGRIIVLVQNKKKK